MDCCMIGSATYLDNHVLCFPSHARKLNLKNVHSLQCNMAAWGLRMGSQSLSYPKQASFGKHSAQHMSRRTFCSPASLDEKSSSLQLEDNSSDDENSPKAPPEELLERPLNTDVLKALLSDSERAKLLKKLSEANQQNRFLKRELQKKDDALVKFKSELSFMEFEIQSLVTLAEEIATYGIPESSRKINGKYIQSHFLSRLEAFHEKLKEQMKDVDASQAKEVSVYWYGMAESVLLMGTFDGWSQGEYLSQEYTGSYTKFSTTLMLRPGRYQIKFLVDGEWHLSSEFPIVGEGLMKNNLLIVE